MKRTSFISKIFMGLLSLVMMVTIQASTPVWTFTPLTATTLNVPANSSDIVQYQVTNQSTKPHTLTMRPIQGITQITTGPGICGSAFALPGKGSSCILSLQVIGSQIKAPITDGPTVCQQGNNNQCYKPNQTNRLRVTQGPPLTDATIIVTGSPLTLTTNGPTGSLTINNTSMVVTATNITANFTGTALDSRVTETGNTCAALLPNSSCTLTYTPGGTAVPQTNFTIQGTNTNVLTAAIAILVPTPTLTSVAPNSGTTLGGSAVTLSGTNLTNASAVTFGGVNATNLMVVNANTATANTPAHAAGTVNVSVITPGGTATLNNGYTYISFPTLTAINPSSGTTSGVTGVTLTGTNLSNTTSVTFGGIAATFINVVNSTTVTAITPTHAAGAVNVVITTAEGSATLTNGYTYLATAAGQASGGGNIACLNGGTLNLIAAEMDNSTSMSWGGSGTAIGASAQSDSNGAGNTTAIVTALGAGTNYAAGLCDAYQVDSQGNTPCLAGNACYDDWFLPATNQLDCLFVNRAAIGGFSGSDYWTSTELVANPTLRAKIQAFNTGTQTDAPKSDLWRVRCVRVFTPFP